MSLNKRVSLLQPATLDRSACSVRLQLPILSNALLLLMLRHTVYAPVHVHVCLMMLAYWRHNLTTDHGAWSRYHLHEDADEVLGLTAATAGC